MSTWYWSMEYGKVMFGYLFFLFLWPSLVFGGHLKDKSRTYRFSFCVTVQVVIANMAVLLPGLFHMLDAQGIAVLFHGIFAVALLRRLIRDPALFQKREIRCRLREYWMGLRAHMVEYGILCVLLLFGMLYFSYGAFQIHSYGFGDLYTHHSWIYGLKEGRIFEGGVYPEAMHCFIYCLNALFGIRVYSILLFLQGVHVTVFLLAGYLLLREIFHWRYTPLLALALFLTLHVVSADLVYGMFRLQITLPLEFGLHTQFLCALYLIRYLNSTRRDGSGGRFSAYVRNDSLLLFTMALAASISIHFYAAIMAFVLCVSFAVFMWKKLFTKAHLVPLVLSVVCACGIAILPMAGALASGIPFNGSINWAVNAMDGAETRNLEAKSPSEASSVREKPLLIISGEALKGIYEEGYAALYGKNGGCVIVLLTGATVVLCLYARKKAPGWLKETCAGYPPLLLFTFLFVLLYAAPRLGYPELISDSRFCSTGHMMMMALVMIPVDVVFSFALRFFGEKILQAASALALAGIWGLTVLTGNYHGYLFYELSRYNAAVEVTNRIMETFPEKSYLIVSPTDELYSVVEHGWHEELLTFVQDITAGNHSFAQKDVLIYVEKKPLQYAQAYFFEGPSWLAGMKYKDLYWDKYRNKYPDTGASQAPAINASEVSKEASRADLPDYGDPWFFYTRLPGRTVMEAKAYYWCQELLELHPEMMEVYYEDDTFVCYHLRPKEGSQYNLEIE